MDRSKQEGSALIVSLIILVILTVIAFSASRTTTLEERMTANSQKKIEAYQTGIAELSSQFVDLKESGTTSLNNAIKATDHSEDLTSKMDDSTGGISVSTEVEYINKGLPPPGYSLTDFVGYNFEMNVNVDITNIGANSNQTLGLKYAMAKTQ
ncbi:pilus assembly PilX family protein [Zooshikella sp. RANM57]|uniref:pilus assembly PilX family protein n=1 Tax=Zooshikella sp. RANM57 TaxID=3425863 RepID=UPI003D6F91C6